LFSNQIKTPAVKADFFTKLLEKTVTCTITKRVLNKLVWEKIRLENVTKRNTDFDEDINMFQIVTHLKKSVKK